MTKSMTKAMNNLFTALKDDKQYSKDEILDLFKDKEKYVAQSKAEKKKMQEFQKRQEIEETQDREDGILSFDNWDSINNFIKKETGCKPYNGAGINFRMDEKTAILKSVDGTSFYDDDLSDVNNIKYTLYGQNGNQDESHKINVPLLNVNKVKHIYVYRKKKNRIWMWYGKYKIVDKNVKTHPGFDGLDRKIIVLSLKKCV